MVQGFGGTRAILRREGLYSSHISEEYCDLAAAQSTGLEAIDDDLTVSDAEAQADDADGQVAKLASMIGGLTHTVDVNRRTLR